MTSFLRNRTANDDNKARKFLSILKCSLRIDKNLIESCAIIPQDLGFGYSINTFKFKEFSMAIARQNVVVRKILIHDRPCTVEQLFEAALESRNKDIKHFAFGILRV